MPKKSFFLIILLVLTLCLALCLPAGAQRSYSLAVLPFAAAGNLQIRWDQRDQLIEGITQMITDRLANQPDLILIERERIKEILTEQHFQQSGAVDLSSAVKIGRILGVDILVLGSINDFSLTSKSGVGFGPLQVSGTTARTVLSARLVGVETGQILGSIDAEGKETGLDLSIDKLQGLSFGTKQFEESILGKALNKAVDSFCAQFNQTLAKAKDRLGGSGGGQQGKIVGITGNYVIVNLGAKGITPATKFSVFRLEKIEGLKDPVRLPNGTLQVVSVDENAAVTQIIATVEGLSIQVGDLVEVEK
ncbi:MAG TPA: CsgG/HfaB family protein [Capillibacterium sp.]